MLHRHLLGLRLKNILSGPRLAGPAFFLLLFPIFFFPALAAALVPGQVMVDPANNSWLVYNRDANNDGKLDPVFVCGPGDCRLDDKDWR